MKRYLVDIKADDKPVLLERVLRVVRHRGFIVKHRIMRVKLLVLKSSSTATDPSHF
jgi:acetolactate synthase regulatory subunit